MPTIEGPFDVTLTPLATDDGLDAPGFARLAIAKRYHGPLTGTAHGQMLAARTAVTGSAAYVAIEHVRARLEEREGTFALAHRGLMDRDRPALTIAIVPDSGTGALEGLRGSMDIRREGAAHTYILDYELPPQG